MTSTEFLGATRSRLYGKRSEPWVASPWTRLRNARQSLSSAHCSVVRQAFGVTGSLATDSAEKREAVSEQCRIALEAGVVERADHTFEWCSPLCAKKKSLDGPVKWRMCADYRGLNKSTVPVAWRRRRPSRSCSSRS